MDIYVNKTSLIRSDFLAEFFEATFTIKRNFCTNFLGTRIYKLDQSLRFVLPQRDFFAVTKS